MTYFLNKYLSVISNSSHVTHVIVAERPWSLEGEFAFFFQNICEKKLFIVFKRLKLTHCLRLVCNKYF
jgi:hypothetical protein